MPYSVRKNSHGQWELVKKDSGRVMGTHDSAEKARKQMAAIYANEKGK